MPNWKMRNRILVSLLVTNLCVGIAIKCPPVFKGRCRVAVEAIRESTLGLEDF